MLGRLPRVRQVLELACGRKEGAVIESVLAGNRERFNEDPAARQPASRSEIRLGRPMPGRERQLTKNAANTENVRHSPTLMPRSPFRPVWRVVPFSGEEQLPRIIGHFQTNLVAGDFSQVGLIRLIRWFTFKAECAQRT